MVKLEKGEKPGEKKVTIEAKDIPAMPENIDEMTDEERDKEHRRRLEKDPGFEEGQPPKSWKLHDEVSYEDELEALWGTDWGAQGIGKLKEVMLTPPPEIDELPEEVRKADAYMCEEGLTNPDMDLWREQYNRMKENYRNNGVKVHECVVPDVVFGPYGYTRTFWATTDAAWVINGGAIIPRPGVFGAQKGKNPVWQKAIALLDIPIIYQVRNTGVAELGGQVWLDDHHMIVSDGVVNNLEGSRQVKQIFALSDAKLIQIPTAGHYKYTKFPSGGTSHVDMVLSVPDIGVVVIYPPHTSYSTIKFFKRIGFDIIEVPSDEYSSGVYNMVVLEPGKVMCPTKGADKTVKELKEWGIEIVPTEMTETLKSGGAVHCATCQLRRDEGPLVEKLVETPLQEIAPELMVPDWEKDWSKVENLPDEE